MALVENSDIQQADLTQAFLQAELPEGMRVIVQPPAGVEDDDVLRKVLESFWRLNLVREVAFEKDGEHEPSVLSGRGHR